MKRSRFFIILLVIGFSSSPAQSDIWIPGPQHETSPTKIVSSNDGEILIATIENSSSWISRDAGDSWECLDNSLITALGTNYYKSEITIYDDFADTLIASVYTTFHENGMVLLVSFNGGETWSDRTPDYGIYSNAFDFLLANDGSGDWLMQIDNYCAYSDDFGLNWTMNRNTPEDDGNFWHSRNIYASPSSPGVYFSSSSFFSMGGTKVTLFKTIDGPGNWDTTEPFIDISTELDVYNVSTFSFQPLSNGEFLVLYSGYSNAGPRVNNCAVYDSSGTFSHFLPDGEDLSNLYIENRSIPGLVFGKMLEDNYIYYSEDYGENWNRLTNNSFSGIETEIYSLVQDKTTSKNFVSFHDHGLFSIDYSSNTWTDIGLPILPCYRDIYVSDEDLYLTDWALSWYYTPSENILPTPIGMPSTEDSLQIHSDIFFASGDTLIGRIRTRESNFEDLRIYKTVSGGFSWEIMVEDGNYPVKTFRQGDLFYFLIKQYEYYLFSSDRGTTFQQIPLFATGNNWGTGDILYMDADYFYVDYKREIDSPFEIHRMPIDGDEWENISPVGGFEVKPELYSAEGILFNMQSNEELWAYDGTSWELRSEFPGTFIYPDGFLYLPGDTPRLLLYSETWENPVYYSEDLGYSWDTLTIDLADGMNRFYGRTLKYDEIRDRLWIISENGIYWILVESLLSSPECQIQLNPYIQTLLTNYPNPFNASTRIQYNLAQPGNVKLDVYDVTGRLVKTLKDSYQSAGMQSAFLDGSGLASGTYFIRLNTGHEIRNMRITLVK